jgi:hypothetical protein
MFPWKSPVRNSGGSATFWVYRSMTQIRASRPGMSRASSKLPGLRMPLWPRSHSTLWLCCPPYFWVSMRHPLSGIWGLWAQHPDSCLVLTSVVCSCSGFGPTFRTLQFSQDSQPRILSNACLVQNNYFSLLRFFYITVIFVTTLSLSRTARWIVFQF